MKRRIFMILLVVIAAVCLVFGLTACDSCSSCSEGEQTEAPENPTPPPSDEPETPDPSDPTDEPETEAGYSVSGTSLTLTKDYSLTADDVAYIQSEGICTFNLGNHALDLNNNTLEISSDEDIAIAFSSGTITNGNLDISVPNGDISFDKVTLDESVEYSLEAAPSTIKISNATLSGKCTIVSDSNVVVTYSAVSDITLAGDGTLVADKNAELGSVTVSESASGATVTVSSAATVSSISLNSPASVEVSGTVNEISVSESVAADEGTPTITVSDGANVDSLALGAAATVSVGGSVSSVSVSESVANDTGNLSIEVKYSATVSQIALSSAADVTIAGEVTSVSVSESVASDKANLSITVTSDATVSQIALNSSATVSVSGAVSSVVVYSSAANATITLEESASVDDVAVAAAGTKVTVSEKNAGNVSVKVSSTVSESVDVSETVTTTVVTEEELAELIKGLHTHAYIVSSRTDATCTEDGSVTYVCADCDSTKTEPIAAPGHMYVYSNVTGEDGTTVRRGTCLRCGHTEDFEAESTSIVVKGLEQLISLIPDGTYVISSDETAPLTIADAVYEVDKLILMVEDGYLSGTLSLTMTRTAEVITINGMIDGNAIYFFCVDYNSGDMANGYFSLASVIKAVIASAFNVYIDIEDLLTDISNITGGSDMSGLAGDIVAAIADVAFEKTESDGNTTYKFDADKLSSELEALGEKTPSALIDEVFGEGTYSTLKELAGNMAGMQVDDFADTLILAVENIDMGKEALFAVVEAFLYYGTGTEIDLDELIAEYAAENYTVAQAIALFTSGDAEGAEGIAASLKQYVAMIFGTDATDESQAVEGMMDMKISELVNPEFLPISFTYAELLEMVSEYGKGATVSITLDGDNNLVAATICYNMGETPLVEVEWSLGDVVPEITLNLDTISLETEIADDGAVFTIGYAGMTFDVTLSVIDETNATISVEGGAADEAESEGGFTISGSLTVAKDDTAEPDSDIIDSIDQTYIFDGIDEITLIASAYDYGYRTYMITHGEDADGEYYTVTETDVRINGSYIGSDKTKLEGRMYTTVRSMRLYVIDGMPDMWITCTPDCGDWLGISMMAVGTADVTSTSVYGTIQRNADGSFTMTKQDSSTYDEYNYTEYTILEPYGYYNPVTGETSSESQHNYELAEVKLLPDSKECEDGLLVTYECTLCGDSYSFTRYQHFYTEETTYLYTIDDEVSCYIVQSCAYCGDVYSYLNFNEGLHDMVINGYYTLYVNEDGVVCITEDEYIDGEYNDYVEGVVDKTYMPLLEEAGIDTTGFYYGYVEVFHCSPCGMKYYSYTIYTTAADGCVAHRIRLLDYGGHDGYDPFTIACEEGTYHEHADAKSDFDEESVKAEYVPQVDKLLRDIIASAYSIGDLDEYRVYSCIGCGEVTSVYLDFYNKDTDTYVYLYYDGKELTSWHIETSAVLSTFESYLDRYGLDQIIPAECLSLNVQISLDNRNEDNDGYTYTYIYIYSEVTVFELYANIYNYTEGSYGDSASTYYYDECTVIETYYAYYDGTWELQDSYTEENHCYDTVSVGENCAEDGKAYECTVCGYSYTTYSHSYSYGYAAVGVGYYYDPELEEYVQYGHDEIYGLYEGTIVGLTAQVYYDAFCVDCGTYLNVTIVLEDDWTLQGDVYIKAEGYVDLNLSGHTIDLNGYALIIYGYNGSVITITDGEYSEDNGGAITDSAKVTGEDGEVESYEGLLVAFNNGGDVTFGSVNVDCEYFASDSDSRDSIYYTVLEATGKQIELLLP